MKLLSVTVEQPEGASVTWGDSDDIVMKVRSDGSALLGWHESIETLETCLVGLREVGCDGIIDGNLDRSERLWKVRIYSDAKATPEQVFEAEGASRVAPEAVELEDDESPSDTEYRTALAMLATAQGDPLKAAAHCNLLYRTAEDPLYAYVIEILADIFPWIAKPLRDSGLTAGLTDE
jgi:hypothetical protein